MPHLARKVMLVFAAFSLLVDSASAEKQYGPGVSDTEIKIGNIMPYSGPGIRLQHCWQNHERLLPHDQR